MADGHMASLTRVVAPRLSATSASAKGVLRGIFATPEIDWDAISRALAGIKAGKKISLSDAVELARDSKERVEWSQHQIDKLNAQSTKLDPESLAYENVLEEHQSWINMRNEFRHRLLNASFIILLYQLHLL